ncbi:hypothetical protein A3K82_02915 [Candidatus Pacearchaeota archaeon RBG_19FT_COMBO_34_9]|nr:MAG: hypothetical protein A3K82_02915 [Candidatus Pacearchaeota archaeon RBG_19FT_COMBO_34_9]OGJ17007.1 MAG: hypothetical protein A3K74_01295 [Candidatus Pacearchaeota archaeon RBG_13_33_26]
MIKYYKGGGKAELKELEKLSPSSWLNVLNPDKEEIGFLVDKFGLEENLLIDGLDLYEMPRIEQENKNIYIFLRVPTSRIENESTSSFLIVITKNNLITMGKTDLEIFGELPKSKYFSTDRKLRCVLQILFYVFRAFNLNVRRILKEVKRDKRNIKRLKEKDILDLVLQEDMLNDYLFSFSPLIDIYNKILKIRDLKFKEDEKEFIEDLVIDLNQTFNTCKSALKTISNMRNYYSTTLTNNLNRIITILTIFTVFLTIPTVISSVYGMNILLPFQNLPNLFMFLVGITIFIWVIILVVFKKKKLI